MLNKTYNINEFILYGRDAGLVRTKLPSGVYTMSAGFDSVTDISIHADQCWEFIDSLYESIKTKIPPSALMGHSCMQKRGRQTRTLVLFLI